MSVFKWLALAGGLVITLLCGMMILLLAALTVKAITTLAVRRLRRDRLPADGTPLTDAEQAAFAGLVARYRLPAAVFDDDREDS